MLLLTSEYANIAYGKKLLARNIRDINISHISYNTTH